MGVEALFDPYTLRARIYPGLLALGPLLVTGVAVFGEALTGLSTILSVLVATGTLYLLSHLVREAGKLRERTLWQSWGGKPTTIRLRWRAAEPAGLQDLIRTRLLGLAPDVRLPTPEEERADPAAADRHYDAAVSVLREATRDKERFPIVFAENVSYGFRRNTWAIRSLGLLTSVTTLVIGAWHFARLHATTSEIDALLWVALAVDVLLLLFWLLIPSDRWVRQAADAYAEALFSAASAIRSQ